MFFNLDSLVDTNDEIKNYMYDINPGETTMSDLLLIQKPPARRVFESFTRSSLHSFNKKTSLVAFFSCFSPPMTKK